MSEDGGTDLEQRVENLEEQNQQLAAQLARYLPDGPSRRDVLKYGATAFAAAGVGSAVTGAAAADGHNDNDGQVGTQSNPVDLIGDYVQANSVSTGDINNERNATEKIQNGDAANLRDAVKQCMDDLAPDGGKIIIERSTSDYFWPASLDTLNDVTGANPQTTYIIEGQAGGKPLADEAHGVAIDISGVTGTALTAATRRLQLRNVTMTGGGKTDGVTAIAPATHDQAFENLSIRSCQVALKPTDCYNVRYSQVVVQGCGHGIIHDTEFISLHRWVNCEFSGCGSTAGDYACEFRSGAGVVESCKFEQTEWQNNDGGAVRVNNIVRNLVLKDCDSEQNCATTATDYVYLFDDADAITVNGLVSAVESAATATIGVGINSSCSRATLKNIRASGGYDVDSLTTSFVFESCGGNLDMADTATKGRYENNGYGSFEYTLSDTESVALDPTNSQAIGAYLISDTTGKATAMVAAHGSGNGTSILSDPDSILSTTEGNAGTTNVYWDSTNSQYEIENQTGSAHLYEVWGMRR